MSDPPESFADVTDAEADRKRTRPPKSTLLPFLFLVLAVVIGGTVVRKIHQKELANLIFTELITTTLVVQSDGDRNIHYEGKRIGDRAVFDLAGLRIVSHLPARGHGGSGGSLHLSDGRRNTRSGTINAAGHSATYELSLGKATLQIDDTRIVIEGTTATIAGQSFDLSEKNVVVLEGPGRIGETRKMP